MSRDRGQEEVSEAGIRNKPTMDIMVNQLGFRERWINLSKTERADFVFPQVMDYVDFSDLDLSGVDFSNRSLYGANFENSDISNANFQGADLRATKLNGLIVDDVNNLDKAAQKDWYGTDELEEKIEQKPIIVEYDGQEELRYWETNGLINRRSDRPAVIWSNGAKAYYTMGKMIRHELPQG